MGNMYSGCWTATILAVDKIFGTYMKFFHDFRK